MRIKSVIINRSFAKTSSNLYIGSASQLPDNLPVPLDDGGCDHLTNMKIPSLKLSATNGNKIDLAGYNTLSVVYCYPKTGEPGKPVPVGWDDIPGARGCTPQACEFRDSNVEFRQLGIQVFGLSTQATSYQQEVVERLDLPYPLISDNELIFTKALNLPTFQVKDEVLIKRLTLVIQRGIIKKVFYPVFPPNTNVRVTLEWIKTSGVLECGFVSPKL